jgi:hypothetical protein
MIPSWSYGVCGRLEESNVRYVVVSGTAVVLHGFRRPVGDLDIVISAEPQALELAVNVLMGAGFAPSLPLALSEVTVMRMFDAEQHEVDVFVRYAIPFEDLWARSACFSTDRGAMRALSLEHLLRVKQINARPHDLTDIEGLRALWGNR